RKAERRAREAAAKAGVESDSQAQHDTQVPKSGDIAEIEAVEAGIAAGAREEDLETPDAPKGKQELSSIPERRPPLEERQKLQSQGETPGSRAAILGQKLSVPVWRCVVCGYLCGRDGPPEVCPICKAGKERFERFI
ncbi:MAG TPA: hypothetical protein PK181_04585, partial [Methanothrix soehngenii]|nr:hypothetical protein [Methanothrix soehngenii]